MKASIHNANWLVRLFSAYRLLSKFTLDEDGLQNDRSVRDACADSPYHAGCLHLELQYRPHHIFNSGAVPWWIVEMDKSR
jgi:hypothetical protein